jgi:hypothetical protein
VLGRGQHARAAAALAVQAALGDQRGERVADGVAADAQLGGQVELAGQAAAGADVA